MTVEKTYASDTVREPYFIPHIIVAHHPKQTVLPVQRCDLLNYAGEQKQTARAEEHVV